VIASLPGTTASSQIVIVCAHLDDVPENGATAPGADDNASGSLAVLTAAEVLRDFTFERTVRFVLFTGEEQDLYGSAAYAAQCTNAGDIIVGVLNLDMIAWDGNSDGVLWLDTRLTSNPGYAADRAIAAIFTNVVTVYGIGLAPSIQANGEPYSDHASFWDEGYAAILAIEPDSDFNPNYHSTADTANTLKWSYYARFVQAAIGTVAHLAVPVDLAPFDAVRVVSGPFLATSTVGHGTFVARHQSGALEGGDRCDAGWSNAPVIPLTNRLALMSRPGGTNLYMDARPTNSETIFFANLVSVQTNTSLTTTNRLRFDFVGGADTNGAYLVRVVVTGQYVVGGATYTCVTNLRDLVSAGGFLAVPASLQVTNRAVYGSCEIRRLGVQREPELAWDSNDPSDPLLRVEGPPGIQVADAVEWSDTLTNWTALATLTNRIAANTTNFSSGENPLYPSTPAPPPDGQPRFFRLRRRWISP
jgi:hypothetical protein